MLICRNAEGVHGQRKVGNSCFTVDIRQPFLCQRYILQLQTLFPQPAQNAGATGYE